MRASAAERVAGWLGAGPEVAAFRVNVGWQLSDRALRLVVNLVVNVWMVRTLGAQGLGLLGFALSLVGLAGVAGELGLESIVVRDLVRRPGETPRLLGTALALRVAGGLLALGVAVAAATVARPGDATVRALTLVLSTMTLAQSAEVVSYWFQSRAEFPPFIAARGAGFVVSAALKAACLALRAPLPVLGAAIALEAWASAAGLFVAYRARRGPAGWRADGRLARSLLGDAWPLVLNGAAIVFTMRADQVMLTLMRGPAENGVYAAAQRLSEILWFVPTAVSAAANAGLLRLHAEDPARYARRLERLFRLLVWTAIGLAVPISLAAGPITRLLFGPAFAASAPVLAIHLWAAPALFLGVAQANWFIAEGRQRELLARSLVALAVNLALNALLIPRLGARGSAFAVLAAHLVAQVLVNGIARHTRPLLRMQLRSLLPWGPA